MSADAKPKVDPDQLQERMLRVLEKLVGEMEASPQTLMYVKGGIDSAVKVAEHIRKLNTDLNNPFDMRKLRKLTDADLDQLERELSPEDDV